MPIVGNEPQFQLKTILNKAVNISGISQSAKSSVKGTNPLSPPPGIFESVQPTGFRWHAKGRHYRLARFTALRLSSLRPNERGQTLYQKRESKNCSDQVAQRKVNRILRGRDTCSHSLLRETVTMLRSRDVIHRWPALFWCIRRSCVGSYFCTKEKGITFWHTLVDMNKYMNKMSDKMEKKYDVKINFVKILYLRRFTLHELLHEFKKITTVLGVGIYNPLWEALLENDMEITSKKKLQISFFILYLLACRDHLFCGFCYYFFDIVQWDRLWLAR